MKAEPDSEANAAGGLPSEGAGTTKAEGEAPAVFEAKREEAQEEAEESAHDEEVSEAAVAAAAEGGQKVLPPAVGYAYVAFEDCEGSAKARKVRRRTPLLLIPAT